MILRELLRQVYSAYIYVFIYCFSKDLRLTYICPARLLYMRSRADERRRNFKGYLVFVLLYTRWISLHVQLQIIIICGSV